MIFKNDKYNSFRYNFDNEPDIEHYCYTDKDVCQKIQEYFTAVYEDLCNNEIIETNFEFNDKTIKVKLEDIDVQLAEAIVINSLYVHRLIFEGKKTVLKYLERVGIQRPKDKHSLDYAYYLQFVYLFFFMAYVIFPKENFTLLYTDAKISVENIRDSNTDNAKYEYFIRDCLSKNKRNAKRIKNKEDLFDKIYDEFQDEYSALYEFMYTDFIREKYPDLLVDGLVSQEVYDKTYSRENTNEFVEKIHQLLLEMGRIAEEHALNIKEEKRCLIDYYYDAMIHFTNKALVLDYQKNYNLDMIEKDQLFEEYLRRKRPIQIVQGKVYSPEQAKTVIADIQYAYLFDKKKLYEKEVDKYYKALQQVWSFEKDKPESGFTFLKKAEDGQLYMTFNDVIAIALTRKLLPKTRKYFTKRTILRDLEGRTNETSTSYVYSFNLMEKDEVDYSKSNFRNDLFRILCRQLSMIMNKENCLDYVYYEVPQAIEEYEIIKKFNDFAYLEQWIAYCEKLTQLMKDASSMLVEKIWNENH